MALERLDADDLSSTGVMDSTNRFQKTRVISQSGLFELVAGSRKPQAKPFRKWVFGTVLPSIAKTGSYSEQVAPSTFQLPDFTNPAAAARAWADEFEAHLETKERLQLETSAHDTTRLQLSEAKATIEANVLFDRVRAVASSEVLHISLTGIKRLICPPLSIDAIQALLTKANHPRRPVQLGYGRGSLTKSSFVREGVEEVLCQAFRDATYHEIDNGKRIRMEHDAFVLKEVLLDWELTEEFTDRYSLHITVH